MLGAEDFVLHRGVGDGRAEVVFGVDRGGDLFAEHDGLGRRVDGDFEFGLLVFLDAERAAAVVDDQELVHAECGVVGQVELAGEAAEVVGRERFGVDLLAFGIVNLDLEGLVGEFGFVVLRRTGRGRTQNFEVHGLLRAIDGAVGDGEALWFRCIAAS